MLVTAMSPRTSWIGCHGFAHRFRVNAAVVAAAVTMLGTFPFAIAADPGAGVEADWQAVLALETGPERTGQWKSRDEARSAALAHLARQEKALREFMAKHPGDARAVDAQLRLATLLATRGDLAGSEKARAESAAVLARLERDPATPKERSADIAFTRLSLFMKRIGVSPGADTRAALLGKVRGFQRSYPQDHRVAALLAEVATLYDTEPPRKKSLLEEARLRMPADDLRQRIDDDLMRIAMLGRPLSMQWTSVGGEAVDLGRLRGRVVLIYFFANWSPPSMAGLDWVRGLAAGFPRQQVQALGISLDADRKTLASSLAARRIDWPVHCDGQGWTSPLVRSLGINSLPTLWIVDRRGNLRTINSRGEAATVINQLLREP